MNFVKEKLNLKLTRSTESALETAATTLTAFLLSAIKANVRAIFDSSDGWPTSDETCSLRRATRRKSNQIFNSLETETNF